jgi:hypothetical protein
VADIFSGLTVLRDEDEVDADRDFAETESTLSCGKVSAGRSCGRRDRTFFGLGGGDSSNVRSMTSYAESGRETSRSETPRTSEDAGMVEKQWETGAERGSASGAGGEA